MEKKKGGIEKKWRKTWTNLESGDVVGWNKRKFQVLEYVYEREEGSSRDVADALHVEIHNVRTLLRKYHLQCLLRRYTGDAYGSRIYEITTKGEARIEWIRSHWEDENEERP